MAIDRLYDCCFFTFGRFQPPTIGHEENIKGVKTAASNCDWRVYTSKSHDKTGKNPLEPTKKVQWMKKMFRTYSNNIISAQKSVIECLQDIQAAGYDDATLVVGSDRLAAFQWIHKYNGKDYYFRKLDIVSSGNRDADGDTFAISGTKMRRAAFAEDFLTFRQGIPKALSDGECMKLMKEIKSALPSNFK
tara:strand:+ start:6669 stop:7238 length:570 start_codon:yes stop_codon:yes gene_type:complete